MKYMCLSTCSVYKILVCLIEPLINSEFKCGYNMILLYTCDKYLYMYSIN